MPEKESLISQVARQYCRIPLPEKHTKESRRLLSELKSLIEEELDALEEKKKSLVYHMHELEGLYEADKASDSYYLKAHDSIQNGIHELERRHRQLLKGVNNPRNLVEGGVRLKLSRLHIIILVELFLILTIVYIYYTLMGELPSSI